jgi:hypothetical protein
VLAFFDVSRRDERIAMAATAFAEAGVILGVLVMIR